MQRCLLIIWRRLRDVGSHRFLFPFFIDRRPVEIALETIQRQDIFHDRRAMILGVSVRCIATSVFEEDLVNELLFEGVVDDETYD